MKIPWFRHDFARRRQLDRLFLDLPDAAIRALTGRRHLPPYSLRAHIGGAHDFEEAAHWFLVEFRRLKLFSSGMRVLDIGCGCGRLGYAIATDPDLRDVVENYAGMDVDKASVEWCQRHISPLRAGFTFYHADQHNASYNPQANAEASAYRFPHPDCCFELILLTSVFTHLLENDLRQYLKEIARLLVPGGIAYATFFLYTSPEDLAREPHRHQVRFPTVRDHDAVSREDRPENAIAYREDFVRDAVREAGLSILEPPLYGTQDVLLLTRAPDAALDAGWHPLEQDSWRWTERIFTVRLKRPRGGALELRFRFRISEAQLHEVGPVRLKARIGQAELATCEYSTAGEHLYIQPLPQSQEEDFLTATFELDQAYGPAPSDPRELGVQVVFWSRCGATLRELSPIYLAPSTCPS